MVIMKANIIVIQELKVRMKIRKKRYRSHRRGSVNGIKRLNPRRNIHEVLWFLNISIP